VVGGLAGREPGQARGDLLAAVGGHGGQVLDAGDRAGVAVAEQGAAEGGQVADERPGDLVAVDLVARQQQGLGAPVGRVPHGREQGIGVEEGVVAAPVQQPAGPVHYPERGAGGRQGEAGEGVVAVGDRAVAGRRPDEPEVGEPPGPGAVAGVQRDVVAQVFADRQRLGGPRPGQVDVQAGAERHRRGLAARQRGAAAGARHLDGHPAGAAGGQPHADLVTGHAPQDRPGEHDGQRHARRTVAGGGHAVGHGHRSRQADGATV
jgi:hypothetical protein